MDLVRPPRSPALAPFVASIAYHENALPHALERVLPSGGVALMVNLYEDEFRTYEGDGLTTVRRAGGTALQGPASRQTVIDTDEMRRLVSVAFTPGGAAPFFGMPVSEARDGMVELDCLWGRDGSVLRERLSEAGTPSAMLDVLEAALLAHADRALEVDRAVWRAVTLLDRATLVGDAADALGLTPRTLARRFEARVGLAPKRYARIRRLQRMLAGIGPRPEVDWAEVALRFGYYDQSHLVNDFRDLTGLTPTAYRARSAYEQNHVPIEAA